MVRWKEEDQKLREVELARAQKLNELKETKAQEMVRVFRNKAAFASLLAMGNGVATAIKKDAGDDDKFASVLVGLFGLAYCSDNADECNQLVTDLAQLESHQQRLSSDVETFSQQTGHRVLFSNKCENPVHFSIHYNDLIFGDYSWNGVVEGGKNSYPVRNDIYLRTQGSEVEAGVRLESDPAEVPVKASTLRLNDDSEYVYSATCNN